MRRADRLFRIVLILSRGRLATGAELAQALNVSIRTVYRDVADLSRGGVPVEGAAGVGFRLKSSYHVPPLMFTREELQALHLGAQIVRGWADAGLRDAAESLLAKVEAALPEVLRPQLGAGGMIVPDAHVPAETATNIALLRLAIQRRRKLRFAYPRPFADQAERIAWPLGLLYWGGAWTLAAWCELRQGFRSFRVDGLHDIEPLEAVFPPGNGRGLRDYLNAVPPGDAVLGEKVDALRAGERPWPVPAGAAKGNRELPTEGSRSGRADSAFLATAGKPSSR